jgi:hypothetical protein
MGPTRPCADHVCRFCLVCSAKSKVRLVHRAPVTLEKRRAAKKDAERAKRAEEAAERAEEKRAAKRRAAVDYGVLVGERTIDSFDNLRQARTACLRTMGSRIVKIQWGMTFTAVFHGKKVIGWANENGTVRAAREP